MSAVGQEWVRVQVAELANKVNLNFKRFDKKVTSPFGGPKSEMRQSKFRRQRQGQQRVAARFGDDLNLHDLACDGVATEFGCLGDSYDADARVGEQDEAEFKDGSVAGG